MHEDWKEKQWLDMMFSNKKVRDKCQYKACQEGQKKRFNLVLGCYTSRDDNFTMRFLNRGIIVYTIGNLEIKEDPV